jgi:hypothetical protein
MGRPGRIYISIASRAGILNEVRVGGEAVVVGEGTFSTSRLPTSRDYCTFRICVFFPSVFSNQWWA